MFAGIQTEQKGNFIKMHQSRYSSKVYILPPWYDYDHFRSLRHKLAFLAHILPYSLAPVNIFTQVTEEKYDVKHVKLINSIINRVK